LIDLGVLLEWELFFELLEDLDGLLVVGLSVEFDAELFGAFG
jgi:hypothetical protein